MTLPPTDLDLLSLQADILFTSTDGGRIAAVNSPDGGTAPRLYVASCDAGRVVRIGRHVDDDTARELTAVLALGQGSEALSFASPVLDRCREVLGRQAAGEPSMHRVWVMPRAGSFPHAATLVRSGTPAALRLETTLSKLGMPSAAREAGFQRVEDFWPPYCLALEGAEIAAAAFAARIGPGAAEVGVYTFPAFRGRGFACAATAGWASHPDFAGRPLFYSTTPDNLSSQRVAERLGLRRLGTSVAFS